MSFTLIFDGDIRNFDANPMMTKTPFGVPSGAGIGDSMSEAMTYFEALQQIARCGDLNEARRIAADALAAERTKLDAFFDRDGNFKATERKDASNDR